MTDVLRDTQYVTEDIEALQADFEREMLNLPYGVSATHLADVLKDYDREIGEAEQLVRKHEQQRDEPLKQYEKKLADFAATLPGKDPFYAASFYMDGRFDGTWESHSRNSGDMVEYWHRRGMLLANLNAFLLEDVQPVFMLDVATTEMGGERSRPLTRESAPRGAVRNKFVAVVGHTSLERPMEIVDEVEFDPKTGARILCPSKVMLNVEIDELVVSDNWPTHNMGWREPKAGIRTVDEHGVLHVPVLEAPFPSIGNSANAYLATNLGRENIFGTTGVDVGAEIAARHMAWDRDKYVVGVNHDKLAWEAICQAANAQGFVE